MQWLAWVLGLLGILCLMMELATTNLVFLPLAVGLLAGLGVGWAVGFDGTGWIWSLVVAVVVSAIGLFLLRPRLLARMQPRSVDSGTERLIGMVGRTTSDVSSQSGRVIVSGQEWSARTVAADETLASGDACRIERIDGATLLVTAAGPTPDTGDEAQGGQA